MMWSFLRMLENKVVHLNGKVKVSGETEDFFVVNAT